MSNLYKPMLATLIKTFEPTTAFTYEPKYDGIRCIAYVSQDGSFKLINRAMNNVTDKFPEIKIQLIHDAVIDGELICFNQHGVPDFQLMQRRMNRKKGIKQNSIDYPATFIAFDILKSQDNFLGSWVEYKVRHDTLSYIVVPTENVKVTPTYQNFLAASELYKDWEGLIAKKNKSLYHPGIRSKDWLKLKNRKIEVFYIYGATEGLGRRENYFGALIVGYMSDQGQLILSEVGTGFTDLDLEILTQLLSDGEKSIRSRARYSFNRAIAYWTTPVHKCKVSFLEKTSSGELRQASYEGLING